MIKSSQCRAARGLLKWTQNDLADVSEISSVTIRNFEGDKTQPRKATLFVLQHILEAAGVEFTTENGGGVGVRLKK